MDQSHGFPTRSRWATRSAATSAGRSTDARWPPSTTSRRPPGTESASSRPCDTGVATSPAPATTCVGAAIEARPARASNAASASQHAA